MKTPLERVLKYQNAIIVKVCLQCKKNFKQKRRLLSICSYRCMKNRRSLFRPQTFKKCIQCKKVFGPVERLSRRFCSIKCKVLFQSTGRRTFRITIPKARNAQSLVAYHVRVGNIIKPDRCQDCKKKNVKLEAAHYHYDAPLKVKWICHSCHVKWDKFEPKNGTAIVKRWELFTGKSAELSI